LRVKKKLPPGPRRQKAPFAGKMLDTFLKASLIFEYR
jgi:hypothetical protein